jgi:PASTA domain
MYEGSGIPKISGPSDPEEYSWKVSLSEEQELVSIDDQHAVVYYTGTEHIAFGISAPPARDAIGSAVPTSLIVSEGNVITFVVHHRAGNPATGNPFQYPVIEGEGWEGGFETYVSQMPPPNPPSQPPHEEARGPALAGCVVPRLTGKSLKAHRKRLSRAGCKLGRIRGERSKTARVVKQSPKPGELLEPGARISVTLSDPNPRL